MDTEHNLTITQSAINQVKSIMREHCQQGKFLRITLRGGGCAGFQYDFEFDDAKTDTDVIIEVDYIEFVLDESCFPMLNGSTVDYISDLTGSQFLINVPGAKTCGCGSSFQIL